MRQLYDRMTRAARTEKPILLLGETGTGKELVGRAIHQSSARQDNAFVSIRPALLSQDHVDSDLFGHRKGAFPFANRDYAGLIKEADGGTLFFDEIGDLSLDTQRRLTRVILDDRLKPMGGDRAQKIDLRIIAASNYDLPRRVEEGLFRADLYGALNSVPIRLPALRQRREDISSLAHHFLDQLAAGEEMDPPRMTKGALDHLQRHHWPGNVKELENTMSRLWVAAEDGRITALMVDRYLANKDAPSVPDQSLNIRHALQSHLDAYFDEHGGDLPPDGLYQRLRIEFDTPLIERALIATGGNQIRAAKLLGLNRNTLRTRIKQLGISSDKK